MVTPAPTDTVIDVESSSAVVTTSTAANAGVAAMAAVRFKIPGDQIAKAVTDLPEDQRTIIKWFAGYCRARNLDPDACAALLVKDNGEQYAWASIYAVLTGRRSEQGASIVPVCNAMQAFRRKVEAQTRVGDSGYIATRLSAAIWDRCDRARLRCRVGFIWGDSQIGKTTALVEYTRTHNHGETIYVEAPTGGALTSLLEDLSDVLAIPRVHRVGDLRRRIIECFDPKMLLIIDEGHRFLTTERGLHSLDFIRELYNKAGCGIILSMTKEGRDLFRKGPAAKKLEQLWRRRIAPLELPQLVPKDDLALFAQAYGLEAAHSDTVTVKTPYLDELGTERQKTFSHTPEAIQAKVLAEEGLGVWLMILQDAKDMAKTQSRAITWAAVLKAYCISIADAEVWS
jgi:DNA transposition AAA+ family ATPase